MAFEESPLPPLEHKVVSGYPKEQHWFSFTQNPWNNRKFTGRPLMVTSCRLQLCLEAFYSGLRKGLAGFLRCFPADCGRKQELTLQLVCMKSHNEAPLGVTRLSGEGSMII